VGAFFRDTAKGGKWWRFAKRWLEEEMVRQVNADGTNYETSTSYHRMVMEMFLWSDTLAERSGEPFPAHYHARLDRMVDFVASYSTPGGQAAQIGDNDSGRLLASGIDDGRDHRYLTGCDCGFGGKLNRLLLRGAVQMPAGGASIPTAFPDAGWYFSHRGSFWVGMRAGPVSHGGAHAHCDQLSLLLSVGGQDVLVDRGTGVYTPDCEKRNRYRSTSSHNVMQVNGWEQNGFSRDWQGIFHMPDHTEAAVHNVVEGPSATKWEASHRGYERFRSGMVCQRKVVAGATAVEIADRISALKEDDEIRWFFHLAPGLRAEVHADHVLISLRDCGLRLEWDFPADAGKAAWAHSPAYGLEVPAMTVVLKCRAAGLACREAALSIRSIQ
jgi:hypothetical protein